MKVTFNNIQEEFIYYANRAIKAKEDGDQKLYLICLARANELRKKIQNSGELDRYIKNDNDKPIPR